MKPLKTSAQKVQDGLNALGIVLEVVEMAESTRTSQEAAAAVGCEVAQIAKSLIFKTKEGQRPVLVVASGVNRVNEKTVSARLGEKIVRADAAYVLEATGFAIGGIPPLRNEKYQAVLMDEDLMQYSEIWAAAGTPHAVFRLTPDQLQTVTGAVVVSIK
ncbi:MAG TPA: YbaK/EbsC family protein [Patescibacteria group bacterium]|nr:YbaK/EbsC family protein [Patescibacteria group bacterium]